MEARSRPRTEPSVKCEGGSPTKFALVERIGGVQVEMDVALARGEYERVVQLAEEQEKLLEALMI